MWPCTHESNQPCGVNYIYVGIHAITMTGQEYGLTQYIKDASHLRRFIVRSAETLPNPAKIFLKKNKSSLSLSRSTPSLCRPAPWLLVARHDSWWQGGQGGSKWENTVSIAKEARKLQSFRVEIQESENWKSKVRCKVENRCWHHQGHFCSSLIAALSKLFSP